MKTHLRGSVPGGRLSAPRKSMAIVLLLTWTGLTSSCTEFDTTPVEIEQGTLGEEIVEVFCERMAAQSDPTDVTGLRWKPVCEGRAAAPSDAPPRLIALMANRDRLAGALDEILPTLIHDDLTLFLGDLLPFYDPPNLRLPRSTRTLADLLGRLSADDAALAALERLGHRQGYRPMALNLGAIRPTVAYPALDEVTNLSLRALVDQDGVAREEFDALQVALSLEMATLEVEATEPGERTTLDLLRELLFSEHTLFGTGSGPQWLVARDRRGLALPARMGGSLQAPFVDGDSDDLADIDALGRFVGADGSPLSIPTPFAIRDETPVARDDEGRALRDDGSQYFEYLDVSHTMLAASLAESAPLLNPDAPAALNALRGIPPLLGPPIDGTETYGAHTLSYRGFNTAEGPLFDLIYGLGEMAHRPEADDSMELGRVLMNDHESEIAAMLRSLRFVANQSDLYPNAELTENSIFLDDLVDIMRRITERPRMMEAFLRSFSEPGAAGLGPVYADMMRNRDRITYDPSNPNGPPTGYPLDEPVDRSMPDTEENRSLFQRTVELIDGLNNVQVCNRQDSVLNLNLRVAGFFNFPMRWPLFGTSDECDVINIPNVNEAFSLAILGTYELELQSGFLNLLTNIATFFRIDVDEALELASGIDGLTRHPTPEALARLVFWGLADSSGVQSCVPDAGGGNCNSQFAGQLFAPVNDRFGNPAVERHHGTIFSWETPGFFEGMRPILGVMHTPGFDTDRHRNYMFGEFMHVLANHWATPQSPRTQNTDPLGANFSQQSNLRSYEELLADGLGDAEMTQRLHRLNLAMESFEVRPGVDGIAAMAGAADQLLDPIHSPGLTTRDGRTEIMVPDGSRSDTVTPMLILVDALRGMGDALDADPERLRAWESARHELAELFMGTTDAAGVFALENQRARAMMLTSIPFMRDRLADHRDVGDLQEWSRTLHSRAADTMASPLAAAAINLVDVMQTDEEAQRALSAFMQYLVSEESGNDALASLTYDSAAILTVLDDDRNIVPLVHALSPSMAPNVQDVVAGTATMLDIDSSTAEANLMLMREIGRIDTNNVLSRLLSNTAQLPATGQAITPLEELLDVISEINRATPNQGGPMTPADWRAVLDQSEDFLIDERDGFERLYAMVQNRSCLPEEGATCTTAGEEIESASLCYSDALCTCGSEMTWECHR